MSLKACWKRRLAWGFFAAVLALLSVLVGADRAVSSAARGKCHADAASVPKRPVAMVLGCPKFDSWTGRPNVYYRHRVQAAAKLWREGRCERVLVSSDVDAPAMMADVEAAGVPHEALLCDPKGVRTRDSFLSAAKNLGITSGIVVSQRYHNERSLYIAEELGQDWVAFDATEAVGHSWLRAHGREALARVKAVLDRYVLSDGA